MSGTASGHLLSGSDGLNPPWPQAVDADIVVINHGINDAGNGTSAEAYRQNLRALAAAPARVVFETPLPVSTATVDYSGVMREVAKETGTALIDARAYVLSLPDWRQFATDGVHATGDGYQAVVSGALYPGLVPLIAPLRCE